MGDLSPFWANRQVMQTEASILEFLYRGIATSEQRLTSEAWEKSKRVKFVVLLLSSTIEVS